MNKMFIIKCGNCGYEFYVTGIGKEEWLGFHKDDPDYCEQCGEIL